MKVTALLLFMAAAATPAFALSVAVVPEPSSLTLVVLGAAAGGFLLWRKNRTSKR